MSEPATTLLGSRGRVLAGPHQGRAGLIVGYRYEGAGTVTSLTVEFTDEQVVEVYSAGAHPYQQHTRGGGSADLTPEQWQGIT